MKSVKILALALGLIMLVSGAAFAQTSMTTNFATIPVAPNAQTGLVGEVAFVPQVTAGTFPAGESITITYGAPISSLSDIQVIIAGCASAFTPTAFATAVTQTCGTSTVSVTVNPNGTASGSITIGVSGAALSTPQFSQFIRILGVRLNVNAISPAVGALINASVTNSTGVGTITNTLVPVAIVQEPIAITASPSTFPKVNQTGGDSAGSVTISELFANAFETKGGTNPTQLVVTVTPPAGFTFVTTGYTSGQALTASSGVTANLAFATSSTLTINIFAQNPQSLDSITVPLTFHAEAPVPLSPDAATVTATLAPPLPANTLVVAVGPSAGPLRYAVRTVSVSIKFSVQQAITVLYSVFNVWGTGFNTGFAVANPTGVTRVPAVPNVSGAVPFFASAQPGTVKVWLVPADGSAPVTVTTSATVKPGLGLDASGQVPAGGEWTVLLSDLATAAGLTSFQGQVFFQTNFSDAHGINFISDPLFAVTSQGYPMLVLTDNSLDN